MIRVEDGEAIATAFNIPVGKLATVVEVETPDTPKVAVDGLNEIITAAEKDAAAAGAKDVEVKLDVEKKPETAAEGAEAIKSIVSNDNQIEVYIDLSLLKTTTELNAQGEAESIETKDIGSANTTVLEIAIPYEDAKTKNITVYRYHDGNASELIRLDGKPNAGYQDGTYYVDSENGYIFLYASSFSIYAIGTPKSASGGGGGGYTPKPSPITDPVIDQPDHGTITINPEKPGANDPVVITVTPEEGYETESVTVTDKEGNPVEVIKNDDGTYSFKHPGSGGVIISANVLPLNTYRVVFDLNGKEGIAPDTQGVIKGGKALCPTPDPTAKGYKFIGWYTDKECTKAYDFDTPVEEDITLYALWQKTDEEEDEDFGIYFVELFDDPYDGVHYNAEKDRYEIVYTGAPIKPLIRVTSKADGMLKEGIDYSVSYSNNKNYSKKKPATIRVSGKGFYKSKKVLELYILQADLGEAYDKGLIAGADELKTLSGKKLNPVLVYRSYKLKNSDRDLSNKNNIATDTTTDITGKGNFTGTIKDTPVKVIGKDDQKKGAIKVNLKAGKHVYNGEAHELSITTAETAGELTVTAGSSKTPLTEGEDFTVSYSGNTNTGKAAVTITGIGACNGTVVKNFTIQPDKMTEIEAELAKPDKPVYFNVRGAKPDITVTARRKADETVTDEVLKEGKDYKVSYSSNKKIGKGTYTVKFFNNYSGHKAVTGKYDIVPAPIDSARVEAVRMIYKKPGKYLPKPFVSLGGVQLKNSDYTFKYYEGEVTDVTAEGVKELTSKDKLTLPDGEDRMTVTIGVTAKGNYTGTALGTYEIVRRGAETIDLTKAKIIAKAKNAKGKDVKVARQEYTGYEIEPEIRVLARVNKKWVEVDPSLYTVSYINNLNKGSATILVTGDGEKTIGSKTVKFSISTMRFELFKLIFGK